jgi:hypothetical protein
VEPGGVEIAVGGKQPSLSPRIGAGTTEVLTGLVQLTGAAKTLAP